ncbi:uncharacterized protein BO72DRAFT_421824 [Aspergillus fijiensis CBS 313.89]|uniref:Uncharacterized protein n=1 Tax=Aspergillus fijiensis CBS 313.89 TaxID=1448319 RepID=A0A8G1RYV2_9EURO|nr:uncharacterized protein BO72DRAFT_421824 [Aspergillus fijiensis CBS 313.89]RAK80813.1 hypothetical protein BO72DRAFT_421824 [Aspergillus fijiensis CBS 313.89]
MSRNHGEEVPLGPFDYELCAELHNRIFLIAWAGAGKTLENSSIPTWWGHFQPSEELAARYHPHLVRFFQRVYYHPEAPEFCYYLENLNTPHSLIDEHFNDIFDGRDCYVHRFDQITCKAVFAESREATHPILNYGHGFRPLEDIYADYLQMITENKIEARVDGQWPTGDIGTDTLCDSTFDTIGPWRIHTYTAADVDKAVQAFQDLVHEIEIRLPSSSSSSSRDSAQLTLPWSDPAVRSEAHLVPNSFINRFCTVTSAAIPRPVRFRYFAPGIRLPTEAEFRAQPLRNLEYQSAMRRALPVARPLKPTLLFLADDPAANAPGQTVTTVPNPDLCLNSLLADFGDDKHRRTAAPRPAGLYLTADDRRVKSCENGCRLLLPFGIGRHGWARLSDGTCMGGNPWLDEDPADANYDLYQCEFNGFIPLRDTPLHQVLQSWAQRVRAGDWTVGEDGVADGVERWREADTEAGWRKCWVPVRW